ncbi:DUF2752 domain-containing protein [Luteolibacter ambystomatis]|nr:DUF2752 domain-containing protein [Luteolibacter ambystomatis]
MAAAVLLYRTGPAGWPGCLFHQWTGFHCPGCGMTRATFALLHGDILKAFRYNPLGVVLFPIALIGVLLQAIGWANNRPPPIRWSAGSRGAFWIAVLVIAFWILRNLPWWPFTLLAPPV